MLVLGFAGLASPGAAAAKPPTVTVAIVPPGTTPSDLAGVGGMSVGLLSAGIGRVPAVQTYLDVSQGNRINPSLYDEPLPPADEWDAIRRRAADAPADLVPGLLGQTLREAAVPVGASHSAGEAALTLVDEAGAIDRVRPCWPRCPSVVAIGLAGKLVRAVPDRGLLIAVERPPPERDHGLTIGVAGDGFAGNLTSDSTRIDGLVLSTDIAPTVLDRLGIAVPDEMTGEPIRSEGASDPGEVESLDARLSEIGPRRAPVIGITVLVWSCLAAVAGIPFRTRGLRISLPLLLLSLAYLPLVLLLTAALEPSETAEGLIAMLGAPALAAATYLAIPGFGALSVAAGLSVLAYAVDVVVGGGLTELSLIGPNPINGVRFYGIGNELEAMAAVYVPIAAGAGLAAWGSAVSDRAAALSFGLAALLATIAFAPGAFGADVGAAISIPAAGAVAVAVCLGGGRRRAAWVIAVPAIAVALLVVADLTLGGDAHLTRSVLHAGGLDEAADVVDRRLELSAESFERYATNVILWITGALIVLGVAGRRRVVGWFDDRRALAGLAGAVAGTALGTLANDSGALLLMIGTVLSALYAGYAWAMSGGTTR